MNTDINQYSKDNEFRSAHVLADDEIDLRELFTVIWQGKWLILAMTAIFAVASVIFAISQPNIYKSEALLAPAKADDQSGGGLAALAGQFGGLASLAGINLGGGKADKTELAIQVMKSRQFVSEFIQKHKILPELMAAKKWDIANNSIIYNADIYNADTHTWVRKVEPPYKPEPSMQEAYKEFIKIFSVEAEKDTGMVKVSVESVSPYIAKQWVTWLVADINQVMKKRDVEEAERGTHFLEQQLAKTNVADIRTVLYQLMEQSAKTIMFANVRDEYVFKTIDPALVPEEKAKPKRALICVLGTILGGMLGVMIVLVRYFTKR